METMLQARRGSTTKIYDNYQTKWSDFCYERDRNPIEGNIGLGLEFLQSLKLAGLGYSAVNTARSSVSNLMYFKDTNITFGSHPDVSVFMRGMYNFKPSVPRYTITWDPDIVLDYIKNWSPPEQLPLKQLSYKVLMLILLTTGKRHQTVHNFSVTNMRITGTKFIFYVHSLDVKEGRRGFIPEAVELKAFPSERKLCIYRFLKCYLKRTLHIRGTITQLFITLTKPYRAISLNTMSRWVKELLKASGIDVNMFQPGSTRSASCSKAKEGGAPLSAILGAAGWSRSSTFAKFYDKKIVKKGNFSESVLKKFAKK